MKPKTDSDVLGKKDGFIPGLELAERFFLEAVSPILQKHIPDLKYSAGLIGSGSEVLGFDDIMSTDHHWGPRVMLYLPDAIFDSHGDAIRDLLAENLPACFMGYPTNWSEPNPDDNGTQRPQTANSDSPINHRVDLFTLNGFFKPYLNIDIQERLSPADWLTLPGQKLRSISAGKIFHDDLGLEVIRDRFRWYPHDVWLYILASGWARIGQEEHLMGRAGYTGDEIGSAIIASRLVRDIMRLAFHMERTHPPYPKWFGRAFAQLNCASTLQPILLSIQHATTWMDRNTNLARAYNRLAEIHNALNITPTLPSKPSPFWTRPFTVIWGDRFADAIIKTITDPSIKSIAQKRLIGNIDLITDNTDLLQDPVRRRKLLMLYE